MAQVSTVLDEAAALLSDPDKRFFTNDRLMVYLKRALGEFQVDLINNGSPYLRERGEYTLAANTNTLSITGLVEPIDVWQKSGEDINKLTRVSSYLDLEAEQNDDLTEWSWREGFIVVKDHNSSLTFVVDFYKELFDLDTINANTNLTYQNIRMFAAARTAAIAALYLQRESKIGIDLSIEAELYKQKLINREVRARQSVNNIRKGFFRRRVFPVDI